MARQSTASLSVVRASPDCRLAPPDGLDEQENDVWRAIVDKMPADWFDAGSEPLLTEYVRAKVMCDRLDARVKMAMCGDDVGEVKGLLDMRDKESKRVVSIGPKLRLTQQSRYTPMAAATAAKKSGGSRPWQFGNN